MKRRISTPKTFRQLRQLPLEVSFEQVQQWVQQYPLVDPPNNHWIPLLLQKLWQSRSEN